MISIPTYPAFPRPLKMVAYLFVVIGILSLLDTVVGLFMGRFVFNLGVLYLLIGQGLLRLNPRWLAWAVFSTWLDLILMPIVAAAFVFTPSRLQQFQVFGLNIGQSPHSLGFVFIAATFALFCWQYCVLQSRQVRQLFIH